jgi:hypothetical protein
MKKIGLLIAIAVMIISCKKEPIPDPILPSSKNYLIGTGYTNQPGGFLASYATLPNGNIDNSNAQTALSLSNFAATTYKDKVYGALQAGTGMVRYTINTNGQLQLDGQMALIHGHNKIAFVSDNEAWFTSSGNLFIKKFNPAAMTLAEEIDFTTFLQNNFPHGLTKNFKSCRDIIHRSGKLYVTLEFGLNDFTPAYDSAFVAVVDLSTNDIEALRIKRNCRMAGDWYPYTTSMFTDEQNDLYILCLGAYGKLANKPSKVIRIPNGSTDFDSYELNLSVQSGLSFGTARGLVYGGNGKAYTALLDGSLVASSFFTEPCYKWVEVNLAAQSVSLLSLPVNAGFKGHGCMLDEGKMIFPIFNANEIAIYKYETTNGSTSKIADITGGGYVQFITKLAK